jgi:hypothetical protein
VAEQLVFDLVPLAGATGLADEVVVHLDLFRLACRLPLATGVLVPADQFVVLGVHRHHQACPSLLPI